MRDITFVRNVFKPYGSTASPLELYYDIKFGVYKDEVLKYREKKEQSIKYSLPAYCLGQFNGKITNKNLEQISYCGFDIDDFSIDNVLSNIKSHPNIFMAYKSVSGKGFWLICKGQLLDDADHYSFAWKKYRRKLAKELNIPLKKFDKTSDARRVLFVSYDNNIYINKDSEKLPYVSKPKPRKKVKEFKADIDLDTAVELLSGKVCNYYDWFRLGSILTKFEEGEQAFINISKSNTQYNDSVGYIKRKFKNLKNNIVYFNQLSLVRFMKDYGVWDEYNRRKK